jgi:hypothetical protein
MLVEIARIQAFFEQQLVLDLADVAQFLVVAAPLPDLVQMRGGARESANSWSGPSLRRPSRLGRSSPAIGPKAAPCVMRQCYTAACWATMAIGSRAQ